MKILFYQWHSFMNEGVERAWKQLGIEYDTLFYQQSDWEVDDGIVDLLEKKLKQKKYDMCFPLTMHHWCLWYVRGNRFVMYLGCMMRQSISAISKR